VKILFTVRQLPEMQGVSAEQMRDIKRKGILNSLCLGRALMATFLFLPNAITAQVSFTARPYFWPLPLLVSGLLSVLVFLVFNHRELTRDREKIQRYLESHEHET
jgi:hypothetical protein